MVALTKKSRSRSLRGYWCLRLPNRFGEGESVVCAVFAVQFVPLARHIDAAVRSGRAVRVVEELASGTVAAGAAVAAAAHELLLDAVARLLRCQCSAKGQHSGSTRLTCILPRSITVRSSKEVRD